MNERWTDGRTDGRTLRLGFHPNDDDQWAEFGWVAVELARVKPPEPWSEYSDDKGQVFYYDHNSGQSQWHHPLLETFRTLFR